MISGRDIIFISSTEWDFLWQVHQEIAFQFASAGNRVLYIENTGIRSPALHDAGRVAGRLKRWLRSYFSGGIREVLPNIFVTSPLAMPPFGSAASRLVNRKVFLPALSRVAGKMKIQDPLLWTSLPTDTAIDIIRMLATPASVIMYYCGADFSLLATNGELCRQTEDELLRLTDLVFPTCSELEKRCRSTAARVHPVPAVVNLAAFPLDNESQAVRNNSHQDAGESHGTPFVSHWQRPTIGYVGGLHRYVDYRLLINLAKARPNWSWVFVGAKTADVKELDTLPNVHLLGQRPHTELARHIREFDVCLVPYLKTEKTSTVVPMKINEYLAMGKPIVSTDLPTVCDFNELHNILITAPNSTEQFLRAIDLALAAATDEATKRHRRAVAALGDSKALISKISELVEERIKGRANSRNPWQKFPDRQ